MKRRALILLVLVMAVNMYAEVRLFGWQESREGKTGEKQFGFFLAPQAVMEAVEADAKGNSKLVKALEGRPPEELWTYGIVLMGEAKVYQREKLALFEPSPCGSLLTVDSGFVEMDKKAGAVRVAIKVIQDGKLGDFRGNGVYPIKKKAN